MPKLNLGRDHIPSWLTRVNLPSCPRWGADLGLPLPAVWHYLVVGGVRKERHRPCSALVGHIWGAYTWLLFIQEGSDRFMAYAVTLVLSVLGDRTSDEPGDYHGVIVAVPGEWPPFLCAPRRAGPGCVEGPHLGGVQPALWEG